MKMTLAAKEIAVALGCSHYGNVNISEVVSSENHPRSKVCRKRSGNLVRVSRSKQA